MDGVNRGILQCDVGDKTLEVWEDDGGHFYSVTDSARGEVTSAKAGSQEYAKFEACRIAGVENLRLVWRGIGHA
jgi:hypothetical protein